MGVGDAEGLIRAHPAHNVSVAVSADRWPMSTRKIPRWATVTWSIGAVSMLGLLGINAYRHNLDPVQTVGYFGSNFPNIFMGLVLLGLLLNGAVALTSTHKKVSKQQTGAVPPDVRKRLIIMAVILVALDIVAAWLILACPIGTVPSIGMAVVLGIAASVILGRLGKPLRNLETDKLITELTDKYLEGSDDPNEPARWVP